MTEQTTPTIIHKGHRLPCGGRAGDRLHHDDGTPRGTARSADGRELEWFDTHARDHKACFPCYWPVPEQGAGVRTPEGWFGRRPHSGRR